MPIVESENMLCPIELRPVPAEPLVSILVLFFGLAGTSLKGHDIFFKRRKKR